MDYFLGYSCSPHGFAKLTGVSRSWEAQPQRHRPGDNHRWLGHHIWIYKSPAEEKNKGKRLETHVVTERRISCLSVAAEISRWQWRARQIRRLLSGPRTELQHLSAFLLISFFNVTLFYLSQHFIFSTKYELSLSQVVMQKILHRIIKYIDN